MKLFKNNVLSLVLILSLSNSLLNAMQATKTMPRKHFITQILGMTEDSFRSCTGWHKNHDVSMANYKWNKKSKEWEFITRSWDNKKKKYAITRRINIGDWIKDHPERAAIFQGDFSIMTIGQMDNLIGNNPKKLTNKANLKITVYDPNNKRESDILSLQADPKNNGNTAFQLASTFWGPLEGGMTNPNSSLVNMLKHPVQGEDATTGAAGAALWRKYFMPTYRVAKGKKPYYFLLENLNPYITSKINKKTNRPGIPFYQVQKYDSKFVNDNIKKVSIAMHKDIVVNAGFVANKTTNAFDDIQEKLPVITKNGKIDLNNTQITTQIFTAAYDMGKAFDRKLFKEKNIKEFAKMVLAASYEGTVKAAYLAGKPHLVLTLMGAGAFRNYMGWLASALERPDFVNFIKDTGMQIELTYRPDKYRDIDVQKGWPIRNAQVDAKFLDRVIKVADDINGTNLQNNQTLKTKLNKYLDNSYKLAQTPSTALTNKVSKQAQAINKILS